MTSIFEALLLPFMCLMLLVVLRCCYLDWLDTWKEWRKGK